MTDSPAFRLRHNLSHLLKERRLSAAQLARKTGIAKQVLSDWMSGVQPRKLEQLYVVSQSLNVTLEKLCFAASVSELAAANGAGVKTAPISNELMEHRGVYEVYLRKITD